MKQMKLKLSDIAFTEPYDYKGIYATLVIILCNRGKERSVGFYGRGKTKKEATLRLIKEINKFFNIK